MGKSPSQTLPKKYKKHTLQRRTASSVLLLCEGVLGEIISPNRVWAEPTNYHPLIQFSGFSPARTRRIWRLASAAIW